MNKKQSIGLCSLLLTSVIAHADVSGIVYQDLPLNGATANTYGQRDSNEQGIAGITVTVYPSGESNTTTADGSWSLKSNGKVKIEFTNIPKYLKESAGQSSVQFIDGDSSNINLALYNPSEYTTGKSDIAMTFQPSAALNASGVVALKILTKDNIPTVVTNDIAVTSDDIPFSELGSVWGLAYDNSSETLYTSALVRRHIAMGTGGPGAIYKIKGSVVELFTTIDNIGIITSNTDRNLSSNPADPDHDPIFDEVGRVGLGDIDISSNGKKLYTINLHTNQLVEVDIKTKAQTTYNIGNPFQNCPTSDVTSWGIGQNNGKVYVGSVCTTSVDEGAYVSELNGNTFTALHSIPLNMKGESSIHTGDPLPNNERWRTWITNPSDLFKAATTRVSYPAPILSDIIFDENNGMILGFTDRTSMQAGNFNYSTVTTDTTKYKYDASGDIYRVCKINGVYINEGNVGCTQHDTTVLSPNYPEFFTEEQWKGDIHRETALGGLAYIQGSNNVLTTSFDPVTNGNFSKEVDSSGIIALSTISGEKTMGQIMVGNHGDNRRYNGKAGGIGDIELLTPIAPTEIGNRVWFDENANCVQDANESGIAGVEVSLYNSSDCIGTAEETTITDENGHYLFPVNAGSNYSVCINNIEGQSVLNEKKLTCNSSSATSINNSDAIIAGSDAKISISPLNIGANDHSLDFGFVTKESEVVTPTEPETPVDPVTPPIGTDNNRTVDHSDGSCDCHSYTEDSASTLDIWSMILLISLTSTIALLFRRELEVK